MTKLAALALMFATSAAGPMDRGCISPGGSLGLAVNWNVDGGYLGNAGLYINPGLEYAVAPGLFLGTDVSLAGTVYRSNHPEPRYATSLRLGLAPVVRLCLGTAAPRPFVRLQPSGHISLSGGDVGVGGGMRGSVGLLVMLGHGVALEPAAYASWSVSLWPETGGVWHDYYDLYGGISVGLRSFIFR